VDAAGGQEDDVTGDTGENDMPEEVSDRRELAGTFLRALPVTGTAVSTIGDLLGTETVAASDATAARLDEMQFDLGEGPCWDALRLRRPVLHPDLRAAKSTLWPTFRHAVLEQDVGALFAFPLLVGPLQVGAVDLYSRRPMTLDVEQTRRASELADKTARQVLQYALASMVVEPGDDDADDRNPYSRKIVHQATGMVLAQLRISADDARLVIQAHAFANNRSMMEVAQDILDRRLDLSDPDTVPGSAS
jgi:hypothetical protein